MKAPDINYDCPTSVDDALARLGDASQTIQPLAGGQSLMPMMHLRLADPDVLLDLNKIDELDFIRQHDSSIQIGSMVRYSTLLESSLIKTHVPLLTHAIPYIAHEAVRNRGTIGGSTALGDPAAEMPAILLAVNATIVLISKNGRREVPADEFFIGIYETARYDDELVHSINIPVNKENQLFGFYELARRHGDYAMAGVAITAESVNPFSGMRIAFFSIGERALRAKDAENILNGHRPGDEESLLQAQESLAAFEYYEDANASVEMKAHLARVVLQRALHTMAEGVI